MDPSIDRTHVGPMIPPTTRVRPFDVWLHLSLPLMTIHMSWCISISQYFYPGGFRPSMVAQCDQGYMVSKRIPSSPLFTPISSEYDLSTKVYIPIWSYGYVYIYLRVYLSELYVSIWVPVVLFHLLWLLKRNRWVECPYFTSLEFSPRFSQMGFIWWQLPPPPHPWVHLWVYSLPWPPWTLIVFSDDWWSIGYVICPPVLIIMVYFLTGVGVRVYTCMVLDVYTLRGVYLGNYCSDLDSGFGFGILTIFYVGII